MKIGMKVVFIQIFSSSHSFSLLFLPPLSLFLLSLIHLLLFTLLVLHLVEGDKKRMCKLKEERKFYIHIMIRESRESRSFFLYFFSFLFSRSLFLFCLSPPFYSGKKERKREISDRRERRDLVQLNIPFPFQL